MHRQRVLTNRSEELKILNEISPNWKRSFHHSASPLRRRREMLQDGHAQGKIESHFEWGGDFGAPDETYLSVISRNR
jgi:asparaginyl-tRNA synthetase